MKEIEDRWQALAGRVVCGNTNTIAVEDQSTATGMFALWNIREHRNAEPIEDQRLNGVLDVSTHFTKDDQEKLKKHGLNVIKPDATLPGRFLNGPDIQRNLFEERKQMSDARWEILERVTKVLP